MLAVVTKYERLRPGAGMLRCQGPHGVTPINDFLAGLGRGLGGDVDDHVGKPSACLTLERGRCIVLRLPTRPRTRYAEFLFRNDSM